MWLKYKTPNIHNDIRRQKPIAWIDLDSSQLFILFVLVILLFYFVFIANISLLWKVFSVLMIIPLGFNLIKKFDDTKLNIVHQEYWRPLLQWFRIFLRKISNWNISIDKWADYKYFSKK